MVNLKSKQEANMDQTATLIYANQILLRGEKKIRWDSFTCFHCSKVASDENCGHLRETCLADPCAYVTAEVLQKWNRLQRLSCKANCSSTLRALYRCQLRVQWHTFLA